MPTEAATPNNQRPPSIEQAEPSTLHFAIDRIGTRKRFRANSTIYGADQPAHRFYKVITGFVRCCKVDYDGRRLIAAFYVPGDIFGLDNTERRLFSAEAVIATETLVVDRTVVMSLAEQEAGVAYDLWAHVANEVHRMQSHLVLLKKSASERVAMFLLEMSERLQLSDINGLPMSRDDIADYLALRSETVSRILTRFEKASVIALRTHRHIVLRDRAGLERMLD